LDVILLDKFNFKIIIAGRKLHEILQKLIRKGYIQDITITINSCDQPGT
jgi:hypothetical protein